jgi:hypothetical protein
MLRRPQTAAESGGRKALMQILLLILGTVGVVAMLWVLMHNLLHML